MGIGYFKMDNFQDAGDPTSISTTLENLAPSELPLQDVLLEEAAHRQYCMNYNNLNKEDQVDPGYSLLQAPVTKLKKLWGPGGPLRGFLGKKDKKIIRAMVRFNEYDPIDFWPMVNGKHALVRSIAVSMYFGLIDFKKICPSCDGNMKLHPKNIHRNYTDGFHWICCEDGRTLFNHTTPKLGKKKK